ncbi:Hypothetical predicted protein [Mytilus galloprovincialis]|uniref:Uncharacterized protein n=1 Tax=Mytilus galloprovincialis TaxID=29158 RepID=A0A8B6FYQ3_MYTGA|nr:Hypothetical predicted protein [Mytilus galloprovincialis]
MYPVKFTFHSTDKTNLQGQPVKVSDTGFIHVLSSMPRKSFWDQGITQLMSVESMDKVGIKEIGPGAHQPISTAYVNEENEAFTDISNLKRTVMNNTLNLTLPSAMYTTAIKISSIHIDTNTNITQIIKMVAVVGCTRAVIDTNTGITNTNNQEWKLKLSENQIQTSPYLKVIPKSKNTNINREELFNLLEKPVSGSFSLTIPLAESQTDCNFTAKALHNVLEQTTW